MNKLHDLCQKIFTLEKVLSKKRDPVTHKFFIELFSEVGLLSSFFIVSGFFWVFLIDMKCVKKIYRS